MKAALLEGDRDSDCRDDMPNYTCPSCRQTFHATDNPEGKCVICGAYLKSFRPRDLLSHGIYDMRDIAFGQRWIIRIAGFALLGQGLFMFGPSMNLGGLPAGWVEVLPTVMLMYPVARLLLGLGDQFDKILVFCLAMFIPVINIILLIAANSRATEVLERADLEVGLWGVSAVSAEAAMDSMLCLKCGYNLTGNASGVCPECGTATRN